MSVLWSPSFSVDRNVTLVCVQANSIFFFLSAPVLASRPFLSISFVAVSLGQCILAV